VVGRSAAASELKAPPFLIFFGFFTLFPTLFLFLTPKFPNLNPKPLDLEKEEEKKMLPFECLFQFYALMLLGCGFVMLVALVWVPAGPNFRSVMRRCVL